MAYTDHMTQEMHDVLISEETSIAEYSLCHAKHMEAYKAASIRLPTIGIDGEPVLHGARMVIHDIAHYWLSRRDLAANFLDRKTIVTLQEIYMLEQGGQRCPQCRQMWEDELAVLTCPCLDM